jgi:hypothetical protein
MANENEFVIPEIVEESDEEGNDNTDWKSIALAQNEAAKRFSGLAKRNYSDLKKLKEDPRLTAETSSSQPKEEKKGFDYAEKAFLKASGIQNNEYEFVWEAVEKTGKSLEEILENKYFQAELKERREDNSSKEAIPKGSKNRSSVAPIDTVDYWLAKGELPPKENKELRREVINAKIKQENTKNKFSDRSVVI